MTAIEFQFKLVSLEDKLLRFAYSLTADKDDAKDLLQETFLKALKYCDKYVLESNFKAWTYTIMKNTFINNYRRAERHITYSDHSKEGYCLNYKHASEADSPESIIFSKELENIIEALDDDSKMPFMMHHNGYKYIEIAEKLNVNLGTVKSRIFFTRKKLKKQLNEN